MQAGVGLLVTDVWSNSSRCRQESLFYQLLDSNLFTHRNTYAILREATSETYGPRVYLLSYKLSIYFLFASLLFLSILQNTKNIFILSYYLYQISLSQVAVKGLTTPLLRWLRVLSLFVQVRSLLLDLYLGSQKLREILTLLLPHHPFLFKENQHKLKTQQKLHGNISQNGYGNAIIGRYGVCFEEGK